MYVTAFNTTAGPITIDAEGRQIGARDWGTADKTGVAKDAFDSGDLVVVAVDGKNAHPDAAAAAERTAIMAERADRLDDIDKDVLAAAAEAADVAGAADLTKPELVAALAARPDVPLPDAPQAAEQTDDPGERKSRRQRTTTEE